MSNDRVLLELAGNVANKGESGSASAIYRFNIPVEGCQYEVFKQSCY